MATLPLGTKVRVIKCSTPTYQDKEGNSFIGRVAIITDRGDSNYPYECMFVDNSACGCFSRDELEIIHKSFNELVSAK